MCKKQITLVLKNPEHHRRFKLMACHRGVPMTELFEEAMDLLEAQAPKKPIDCETLVADIVKKVLASM